MADIFGGKDKVPPNIRTIVVPSPGCVLMEADFCQAELFVLAKLSGDDNMWSALTTPGKDLHDNTAITAFDLTLLDPDGNPIDEAFLLELAKTDIAKFEEYQKNLIYMDQLGKKYSRKEFKSGIRVSAKALNFGIPYGRGATDIARQVQGETGTPRPLSELEAEVQEMMDAWKTETYPSAWAFMEQCSGAVDHPGYLVNPWGRQRRFPRTDNKEILDGMRREAQNFPIQSTVADTCMIAMQLMLDYREKHGLNFSIVNQIHDALMIETPEAEIEAAKQMFRDTMGSIDIPIHGDSLRLGIDIEILDRWGEKR